jgi:ureidoacrylate peracid hydrolase
MSTTVLVIDMQNAFCRKDGSWVSSGLSVSGIGSVISACASLLKAARSSQIPVVFVQQCYRPGRINAPANIESRLPPGALIRGSWDVEIIDELNPRPGEEVIEKPRFDAFAHTDLELVLRGLGTAKLLLAGVLTNVCVESTARTAQQRDFHVGVASDATGATTEELHRGALAAMREAYITTQPWQDLFNAAM